MEIRLPLSHNNLSGIAEQAPMYMLFTNGPFIRPVYPGNPPVFPDIETAAQRANIQEEYHHDKG